jgi:hypothetical protein
MLLKIIAEGASPAYTSIIYFGIFPRTNAGKNLLAGIFAAPAIIPATLIGSIG